MNVHSAARTFEELAVWQLATPTVDDHHYASSAGNAPRPAEAEAFNRRIDGALPTKAYG
jgi:hypothetical protein